MNIETQLTYFINQSKNSEKLDYWARRLEKSGMITEELKKVIESKRKELSKNETI
jgi:hypothetical protein